MLGRLGHYYFLHLTEAQARRRRLAQTSLRSVNAVSTAVLILACLALAGVAAWFLV